MTTVRASIMANLVTTLEAVSAVKLVSMDIEKVLKSPLHPAIFITAPRVRYKDDRLDMIQATLSADLILVVRGYGTAIVPDSLWSLIEDVRLALFVDVQRGGFARDTHIEYEEPSPILLDQPEWACAVGINVLYAHDRLDPTTPR